MAKKRVTLWTRVRAAWSVLRSPSTLSGFVSDEKPGDVWGLLAAGGGPADVSWSVRRQALLDAREAWRTNALARRVVNLVTDYVVGDGVRVDADVRTVSRFVRAFWQHRQNRLDLRLREMVDELTRSGELFVVLHRNPLDGMSYVRLIPAAQVREVRWRPGDYEHLTEIGEQAGPGPELCWWPVYQADQPELTRDKAAVVLYFAINRPSGAVRGSGDLDPVLYWLQAYSEWLDGRVQLNRIKSAFYYDVEVDGAPADVEDARQRYMTPPSGGVVVVHSAREKHHVQQANISAGDAEADGLALRLLIASGSHLPIHFLSEVMSGSSLGSSVAMNEPTFKHLEARQAFVREMLLEILETAYARSAEIGKQRPLALAALQLRVEMPEIQRDDNQQLALAAKNLAEAFALARSAGLERDARMVRLIYKFAGVLLAEDEVQAIVRQANQIH
jgi:hypothetical protein